MPKPADPALAGCPCGSGLSYASCCEPFHVRASAAPNAEALMRSRYTAFALGRVDYLWETLHPEHDDRALDREEFVTRVTRAIASQRFRALRILETRAPDAEGVAEVLFSVSLYERGKDISFVELSRFVRDERGWRYLYGTTRPRAACPKRLEALTIATFDAPRP